MNLKIIFPTIILFLITNITLKAQKISQKGDLFMVDGNPYLYISKTDTDEKTILKVKTLDQKLIVLAVSDDNTSYYELNFLETNQIAYLQSSFTNMSKRIVKEFYSNNLIVENKVSEEGKKIFLLIYKDKPENLVADQVDTDINIEHNPRHQPQKSTHNYAEGNGQNDPIIARNRAAHIYIIGKEIRQANQLIGTATNETIADAGQIFRIFRFYSPNGMLLAEANYAGISAATCLIITQKDNRRHTLNAPQSATSPQNIVEFLVRNFYM